ncbi:MAG: hypothetical protein A2046_11875 [Bacteroidetes bacterium GWA2_30_7]|nr:MAG: hypothetical protein A2046_11875 [Bacteroidetes bacterium GWA2_30_7]
MVNQYIHIVSFNIPLPANYGGIIDVFYKLKALKEEGVKIILHCFEYGRPHNDELLDYCEQVYYYKRPKKISKAFSTLPFIVNTRSNKELLDNLLKDNYPILFEGLHTTYFIGNKLLDNRMKIIRSHNIEHHYYYELYLNESNILKKIFFKKESEKLNNYEKNMLYANNLAAISKNDNDYLFNKYNKSFYLPAFHPNEKVLTKKGLGDYILFHGNLSVNENIQALQYLADNVFDNINYNIKIAGNNPSKSFTKLLLKHKNVEIIKNPDDDAMNKLIENAQINLLFTFQDTGIKLKLLSSLFLGRHCLVNKIMVSNTELDDLCHIKDSPEEIIEAINSLMNVEITDELIDNRKNILNEFYSNKKNIQILINQIFRI